ncbi:MAG: 4Fe-4S binding protein [Thermodesulfobacteriota bacterium]
MNGPQHIVAYCSPAGSTAGLAEVIEQELTEREAAVSRLNLGNPGWEGRARELIAVGANLFLWLGSPVYALHPVPPVEAFLGWLPDPTGRAFAVPFVTWGAVTSGTALLEMGRALEVKGFQLAGAAAVPARHSSMWQSEQPPGAGRPDARDKTKLAGLVREVLSALSKGALSGISSEVLDYQSESVKRFAGEIDIDKAKQGHPGYRFDQDLCTQCGICRDNCPAGAIRLDPFPVRDENCFVCNACARLCPEGAMSLDSSGMEKRLRGLQELFREEQTVRLFF